MIDTGSPTALQPYLDAPVNANGRIIFSLMRLNATPHLYAYVDGSQTTTCKRCGATASDSDPINEYHLLLTCDMAGVGPPRERLTKAVYDAVGEWAGAGTQDEIAGRLLGADGVWATAPTNLPSENARTTVTTATIVFLTTMAEECWATRGQPASESLGHALAIGGGAPALPSTAGAGAGAGLDGFNDSDDANDIHADPEHTGDESSIDDGDDGDSDSESVNSAQRQLLEEDMDDMLAEIELG